MADKLTILLKTAREKKALTQVEVSEKMKCVDRTYSVIENGSLTGKPPRARVPQKEQLKSMSKILGIPYAKLVDAAVERYVVNKRKGY